MATLKTAAMLLALTMFGEARSEGEVGMRAVGHVVMNRVEAGETRFGKSVAEVVWKPGQFPCWRGSNREAMRSVAQLPKDSADYRAWQTAKQLALKIIARADRDPTRGALFYHHTSAKPGWAKRMRYILTAAKHRFYREADA